MGSLSCQVGQSSAGSRRVNISSKCSEIYGVGAFEGGLSRLVDCDLWLMPLSSRQKFAEWGTWTKVPGFDLEYLSHGGKSPFFFLVRSATQVNQHLGTGKWPGHFCHPMARILLLTRISNLPQMSYRILRETTITTTRTKKCSQTFLYSIWPLYQSRLQQYETALTDVG